MQGNERTESREKAKKTRAGPGPEKKSSGKKKIICGKFAVMRVALRNKRRSFQP
jgi:hypothetical protein